MKKTRIFAAAALTVASLLSLTGCVSIAGNVVLDSEGLADVSYSLGYEKAVFSMLLRESGDIQEDQNVCDAIKTSMEEGAGVEMESLANAKWVETEDECVVSVTTENVDFTNKENLSQDDLGFLTDLTLTITDNEATASLGTEQLAQVFQDTGSGMTMDNILTSFDYNVTYPGSVTTVTEGGIISEDGKTASWSMESLKKSVETGEPLAVTGTLSQGVNPILFVIAGLGAVVLVGGIAAAIILGRRNPIKTSTTETSSVTEDDHS